MKICYIISTCNKYLDTRVKYQMNTFLKHVNQEDIFYLTSHSNIEKRQFGWNCMDDEKNISWKYIHFIYNMYNIINYDWYVFIDDDTFVFIDNLKKLLKNYNYLDNYYIGYELDHLQEDFCLYMSGGAGYAISNGLYNILYKYVRVNGINKSYKHWCDDLCIGLWINTLKKKYKINQINNTNFLIDNFKNIYELNNSITAHKIITKEDYDTCYEITLKKQNNINGSKIKPDTVFVLLTDLQYFNRAKRTIIDLRSKGNWNGEIILITLDFSLNNNFKEFYNIIEVKFPLINKTQLINKIGKNGFSNSDKREIYKLAQWEKLHVFDEYFMKWNRVVFLDAGMRILDDVQYLLNLEYKGKILAPKDGRYNENPKFNCQLSYDNTQLIEQVKHDFGENILNESYFLNCIWIYDTNILKVINKNQMIDAMNIYTLCKTNEMGIMNLLLTFKYDLWEPFPFKINIDNNGNQKILFDWCELNNPNTSWKDYCYIKYPVTISFEDC